MVTSLFVRDCGIHEAQVDGLRASTSLSAPTTPARPSCWSIYLANCLEFRCSADIETQQFDALLAASDMLNDAPVARIWAKHLHAESCYCVKKARDAPGTVTSIR